MTETAQKTDPKASGEKVKTNITKGVKGGNRGSGQRVKRRWPLQEYSRRRAAATKMPNPPKQIRLTHWTEEAWGTKSGAESGKTGERPYFPRRGTRTAERR